MKTRTSRFRDSLSSYGMIDLSLTILDNAGANPDYTDDGRKTNLHQHGEKNLECQIARHTIRKYYVGFGCG